MSRWRYHPLENPKESSPFGKVRCLSVYKGTCKKHSGIDYKAPVGTTVRAPLDAVVEAVWDNHRINGNAMRLLLRDGTRVGFAHLSRLNFRVGEKVRGGTVVAYTGNTGTSTAPHLHVSAFPVGTNTRRVDPMKFLPTVDNVQQSYVVPALVAAAVATLGAGAIYARRRRRVA